MEKRAFSRSIAAYQVAEDVLICSNDVTTSETAEIVVTTWLSFMTTHCHSPKSSCLLHRPNRQVEEGGSENHYTYIFQVLDGGSNLCSPSKNTVLFLFCYFPSWGGSSSFHLAFPIIALTSLAREPLWWFWQLLSMAIPVVHSRTGDITTGCVPTGPIVRQASPKSPLIIWFPETPTLTSGPQWYFGCSGISSEAVASSPWKFWLFVFHPWTAAIGPFGEVWEKD